MATTVSVDALRKELREAFPPRPFYGIVSAHDECDDGIALRRELADKRWDEVAADFVDDNSLSLALLEPDALVAFLPAWILRSVESFGPESLTLEFTVYFLCPGDKEDGWDERRIAETTGIFTAAQKKVVGDFLKTVLDCDALGSFHWNANFGLRWWRGGERS